MTAAAVSDIRVRQRIRVAGVVQGVGFRPFVHRLAGELGLSGVVGNDPEGVFVEVEGNPTTWRVSSIVWRPTLPRWRASPKWYPTAVATARR